MFADYDNWSDGGYFNVAQGREWVRSRLSQLDVASFDKLWNITPMEGEQLEAVLRSMMENGEVVCSDPALLDQSWENRERLLFTVAKFG